MEYKFSDDKPIYIQLVEQLEMSIAVGKYAKGEKLPSVREFSFIYKVNPNTIQKALNELESINLIYTERTNGKFVTNDEAIIKKFYTSMVENKIKTFINDMNNIGISNEEIIKYLNK